MECEVANMAVYSSGWACPCHAKIARAPLKEAGTHGNDYARTTNDKDDASTGPSPVTLYWQHALTEARPAWFSATIATHVWQHGNDLSRKKSGCRAVPPGTCALRPGGTPAQFLESQRVPGQ